MARPPADLLTLVRRHRMIDVARALLGFAGMRMKDTQLQEVASSMTLTTLLSLIPLLAVSLAAFAAFPSFAEYRQELEAMVFNSFLPPQESETIVEYIRQFSAHASGLGIFGLAGLALTALLLIDKFFVTVNRIFKVRRMRPWSQRAVLYWAILTLAPTLIALSLTLSTHTIRLTLGHSDGSFPGWIIAIFQILLQGVGYAALYKLVPNCWVPFRHALVGGMIVAIAGSIVREGFEIYVTSGTLSTIYGAFVALPVFLLWLYLTWFLVFSGAAITATIPLLTSGRYLDSYRAGNDFLTGVALLRVLTGAKAAGLPSVPVQVLADEVDSYPEQVNRILGKLGDAGYCGELKTSRHAKGEWALLCDPEKTTLRDALCVLLIDQNNTLVQPERPSLRREAGLLFFWWRSFIFDKSIDRPLSAFLEDEEEERRERSAREAMTAMTKLAEEAKETKPAEAPVAGEPAQPDRTEAKA